MLLVASELYSINHYNLLTYSNKINITVNELVSDDMADYK